MCKFISSDVFVNSLALVAALVVTLPIFSILSDDHQYRNRYYGDVSLPLTRAMKGEFYSWAKAQDSEFIKTVSFEVLTAFNGSQDQSALNACLILTIGGYWNSVIVPTKMDISEVVGKATLCIEGLNYHPNHFEDITFKYEEWYELFRQ